MLRERRLRPIRNLFELISSSGLGLDQIIEAIKAVSGFLNGLIKEFQAIEGPTPATRG